MQTKVIKRRIVVTYATGLVGLLGGWIGVAAIAPLAVHAYVSRVDVVVDVQPGEAYETFLSRAEAIARAATQRAFDRDILTSEVYVIIVGRRPAATVQVLSIQVSRNQWRSRPDPRRWITYYSSARVLLGFGGATRPAIAAPPASTPEPTPNPPTPTQAVPSPGAIPVPNAEPPSPLTPPSPELTPATTPPSTLPTNIPAPTSPRTTPPPPSR